MCDYIEDVGNAPTSIVHEVNEYRGQERIVIACTQLPDSRYAPKGYTPKEQRKILNDWLDFLQTNTKAFRSLRFVSHVPQRLFDAACRQENLESLYLKWGNYKDLSALENLHAIKSLYIGSGAGVRDIAPLCSLKSLVVLGVENFKRIEDYSSLTALTQLEELHISSGILGRIAMSDIKFLRDMPNLKTFGTGATTIRNKYSKDELKNFFASLPHLKNVFVNGTTYNVQDDLDAVAAL